MSARLVNPEPYVEISFRPSPYDKEQVVVARLTVTNATTLYEQIGKALGCDQQPVEQPTIMWQVWAEQDMTEGRQGLAPQTGRRLYRTEQAAWDAINDLGGVAGRRPGPGVNCYPMHKLEGVTTWQAAKERLGHAIDFDVRPVEVANIKPAS